MFPRVRLPGVRGGAVVALAVAAGLLTWVLVSGEDDEPTAAQTTPAAAAPARIVGVDALGSLGAARETPFYWAGPRAGVQYELTQASEGRTFVRYLPEGVESGDPRADFLTVATYPQPDGFAEVQAAARRAGAVRLDVPGGGIGVFERARPTSVFVSYPGADYQVEVYSPDPGEARGLVESGEIVPVGAANASPARAVSATGLQTAANDLDVPLFWAGARPGATYELTRTSEGRVFVRYLPRGVAVGDPRANFLTVATYPQEGAFEALRAAAKRPGAVELALPGGGLAVFDRSKPTSVYFAAPGGDYQVEVYSPKAGEARRLVESGAIRPVD